MAASFPCRSLAAGHYVDAAYAAQIMGVRTHALHRLRRSGQLLGHCAFGTGKGRYILRCPLIAFDGRQHRATIWIGVPGNAQIRTVATPPDMTPNYGRVWHFMDGVLDYPRWALRCNAPPGAHVFLPAGPYVDCASAARLMGLPNVAEWHRRRKQERILGAYRFGRKQGFHIVRYPLLVWHPRTRQADLWTGIPGDGHRQSIRIPEGMVPDYERVLHIRVGQLEFADWEHRRNEPNGPESQNGTRIPAAG